MGLVFIAERVTVLRYRHGVLQGSIPCPVLSELQAAKLAKILTRRNIMTTIKTLFGEEPISPPKIIRYDDGGTGWMAVERSFLQSIGFVPKDAAWKTKDVVYFSDNDKDSKRLWHTLCSLGFEVHWNHSKYYFIDLPYKKGVSPLRKLKRFVEKQQGVC